jgi:hypothetical protein
MLYGKILLYIGICQLCTIVLIAQAPPKNKTLTNVVGYQIYQQKQWLENQLPKNSMQYKTNFKYQSPNDYKVSAPDLQLSWVPLPDVNRNFFTANSSSLPGLKSYVSDNGISYYKWQKSSWWKYLPDHIERQAEKH